MYRLLIALVLLAPLAMADSSALRLQGSNTIGAKLAPALVAAMLGSLGATDVRIHPGSASNEVLVSARGVEADQLHVEIAAHGSSTGFVALASGRADIATASRAISAEEARRLRPLGDLRCPACEQVIGLDGIAVIVHPDNPLSQLNTRQLALVFAGEIRRWEQLGVAGGQIHLYARDDRSGTFETFKALVLDPNARHLDSGSQRFESAEALAARIRTDRQGIGFASLGNVNGSKVVAIAEGEAPPMLPTRALVASEDYPLARRLYFYLPFDTASPMARALVEFTQSPAGQAIVAQQGFVAQQIEAETVERNGAWPPRYRQLAEHARRLNVNFRFREGSAELDSKALRDVRRVVAHLRQTDKLQGKVVLAGFGDSKQAPGRAALLSRLRAMTVRRELARDGVQVREVIGMGDDLPVAGNDQLQGRLRNRRVEIWVH